MQNNPETPANKRSAVGCTDGSATCCLCNWTNVNLLNLGQPGAPRWTCHGCCKRLLDENAALRDAIGALHDFVDGKRHDTQNIAAIMNGALKLKSPNEKAET